MDLYQKFQSEDLIRNLTSRKIVVAVSGGADSIALLHLLWRLSTKKRLQMIVAHIQHQLRGKESLEDQRFVEKFASQLGVSCIVRSISISRYRKRSLKLLPKRRLGVEESARHLRYRALSQIAQKNRASILMTAHTATDQAETFLLHLLRGAGIQGLSGMLPERSLRGITHQKNHSIRLVRPLLSFERKDILEYLKKQKISFCEDRSNQNLEYRRNWVRARLIPLLQEVQPKIISRIGNLTSILQRDLEYWKIQFQNMKRQILVPKRGSSSRYYLDLVSFFGYHISLRYRFLHELFPQETYQKIGEITKMLEEKKSKKHQNQIICSVKEGFL